MLQNAYFLAKIGADTAENEQHFAEILPVVRVADVARGRPRRARRLRGAVPPGSRARQRPPDRENRWKSVDWQTAH